MALILVIPIEDFQMRGNVLSLSFSERESRKWPLYGLSDFCHNYLISDDCIRHSGKLTTVAHNCHGKLKFTAAN